VSFDPSLPDDSVNVSGTHPLREALVLVAGIAGVGLALFVAIALAVEVLVPLIPPRFEARIFSGSWIPGAIAPETGEPPDPRAEPVTQLLDRVARHWPENPYTLRVAIWEESTPNALAFPGGSILVTTGLLDQVESENELAFVLAHELGHFRNRDHLRGIGRGVAFALALGALGMSGSSGAAQLAAVSGQLAERGFDRDQEGDADRFGLALVHQEYGHVAGASDFFERLPEPDNFVEKEIVHYLATHPLSDERIEALRAQALARGWSQVGTVVPFAGP
jgi:Zn-dependent protease with chaperone function